MVGSDGDLEIYFADITHSSEGEKADADEVAYALFSDEGDVL